jgi:thiol-disulfide isomerase/thioredoxin
MKSVYYKGLFLAQVFLVLIAFTANAQHRVVKDTTGLVVMRLGESSDPLAKDSLRAMVDTLQRSSLEGHMLLAARGYSILKDKAHSDSISRLILEKFPNGAEARNAAEQDIYNAKGPAMKAEVYFAWVKRFPPSRFPDVDHDHIVYDYARMNIARAYADSGNFNKAEYWTNQCEEDFYKGNSYGSVAEIFEKKGNLILAAKYEKIAMLSAGKYYAMKDGDNAARFAASGYIGLMTSYADLLMGEKKYDEAAIWLHQAAGLQKEPNPRLDFAYAKLLMQQHKYKEAYGRVEQNIQAGHASREMLDTFKVLYVKVNGSMDGYDKYAETIHQIFLKDLHQRLVKEELNQPSVDFVLTDLNGEKVSLENYRGKTVVLDFWATWCGPCKASFPLMARAMEKYKNDTTVKFLFIHTWERDSSAVLATDNARDFIESHHYPFQVLMDLKDSMTGLNKVVDSYKVKGIPTKFVIDGDGKIRFKFTGFFGDDQAAIEEISAMIEMAHGKDTVGAGKS